MGITYRLDELLKRQHMSARKLSDLSGVSTSTISAIRQNKAQLLDRHTLAKLCKALQCTPGDLIVYIPDPILPPVPPA